MLVVRRARYAMVAAAVMLAAVLIWQARGALLPFFIGGVLAYLLTPLVDRITLAIPFHRRRRELARTLAILLVYIAGASVLVSAGALLVPAIISEAGDFVDNIPRYVDQSRRQAEHWTAIYRERVPADVQERVDSYIVQAGDTLGAYGRQALARSFGLLRGTFSAVLGYIVIPFWLFYILKDRHKIGPAIQGWFPEGLRTDVDACIRIIQRVLGSYIRAQLTLGFFIGVVTTIGLWALGVQFYIVLGLIAGITELVPIIGPILGAVPALIVVIATEPENTWKVLLLYIAVQQIENAVLVPRVQGNAVDLHPALIIVLLVVAQQVAGFFGMVVAVPLTAVAKDLFKYVYRRLQEREAELAQQAAPTADLPPRPLSPAGKGAPNPATVDEFAPFPAGERGRGGRSEGAVTPGEASP
jgi:predicted PurR-regulated permease PerM